MTMQRCENMANFRLTRTTIQHNGEAGMRDDDLHRQRFQQRTVGLAMEGLEKGELLVLKKNGWVRFNKSGLCRFDKSGLYRFDKNGFFAFKKAFWFALKKADLSFFEREAACIEERMLRLESAGHQCRS
jgi:hypothetical protein